MTAACRFDRIDPRLGCQIIYRGIWNSSMQSTITLEEAQKRLVELIRQLEPGEELVITENEEPVAKLVSQPKPRRRREPGRCKGMITLLVEDDEHLEGFEETMP